MAKYKRKPEYVEAFQYDGDLKDRDGNYYVPDWAVEIFENGDLYYRADELYLKTYDEYDYDVLVEVGDYIVCYGEYPFCSFDVFEEEDFDDTFELVEE